MAEITNSLIVQMMQKLINGDALAGKLPDISDDEVFNSYLNKAKSELDTSAKKLMDRDNEDVRRAKDLVATKIFCFHNSHI